jgi:hypothetical protein
MGVIREKTAAMGATGSLKDDLSSAAAMIDWAKIFAKKKKLAGIQHYFNEHDDPADPISVDSCASYRGYLLASHILGNS